MPNPGNFEHLKYPGTFRGEPVTVEYLDKGLIETRNGQFFVSEFHIGDYFVHEIRVDLGTIERKGAAIRRELERKYLVQARMFLEGF